MRAESEYKSVGWNALSERRSKVAREKLAWHEVKGVATEQLRYEMREAEKQYGDLLELPHHEPDGRKHPRMTLQNRAPQFSPFAALTGYEESIRGTGAMHIQQVLERSKGIPIEEAECNNVPPLPDEDC